jgi:hypothetical protein
MTLLAITSADLAAWVDAIGTWVVGLAVAAITVLQYRHSRFRPKVRAYRDLRHRIVVRVTNEGAGAGTVEDVDLVNDHDPGSHVVAYTWEFPGEQADEPTRTPLPFALPGLSTAQLVLKPQQEDDITEATRAQVFYGNDEDSGCVELQKVPGTVFGSTSIPGSSP